MTRSVLLALCLVAGSAHADMGTLPNGATIMFDTLWLHEDNSVEPQMPKMVPDSLWHYFNMAHCQCSQPGFAVDPSFNEFNFAYQLVVMAGSPPLHRPVEIWVGSSCDSADPNVRNMMCHRIDSAGINDFASIQTTNGVKPEIPVFDLMVPERPAINGCEPRVLSGAEWVLMQSMGTGSYDFFLSKQIDTDSEPPPQPTIFHVDGAESAIQLSWDAPVGNVSDIAYYQALCATEGNGSVGTGSQFTARYITSRTLCGAGFFTFTPVDITTDDTGVDAGPTDIPDGFSQTDPSFICGEVDEATGTSMRITGLKDGQHYKVALLVIDKFGNAAGTMFNQLVTPKPVDDFWKDLHNRGSRVEGGFCLIAETYGNDSGLTNALRAFRDDTLGSTAFGRWVTRAYYATLGKAGAIVRAWWPLRIVAWIMLLPFVAFALLWHVLTLPGLVALIAILVLVRRRRWRALRMLAPATLALLWLAPGHAHAQSPYWEDQTASSDTSAVADEAEQVLWHAGIRVGPYTPQIDAQIGTKPGPYAAMFGKDPSWVPMLDVDRVVWSGVGQLLVGGSAGYLSRTAHAWAICTPDQDPFLCDPSNPMRLRSGGDKTSFKLIPLAATVSYRFTWLDDEYFIPVVPYVKAGLDYYIWWSTDPNGNFSNIMGNKARGASLGVQGTVGLALRAERIDANAARSMRDSGIYHAGFYGEFTAAKVDGFGSSKKLSVGANTWFAGVDFEF